MVLFLSQEGSKPALALSDPWKEVRREGPGFPNPPAPHLSDTEPQVTFGSWLTTEAVASGCWVPRPARSSEPSGGKGSPSIFLSPVQTAGSVQGEAQGDTQGHWPEPAGSLCMPPGPSP